MKNSVINRISVCAALLLMAVVAFASALFLLVRPTLSLAATIKIDGGGATVYVSGDTAELNADGSYTAQVGDTVRITAVNETQIFSSMNISNTDYTTPVQTIVVPEGGLEISVATRTPEAKDKGTYFGNPYIIDTANDVVALANILTASGGTDEDYAAFGLEKSDASKAALQSGYFRLTENLVISNDDFFGIGERNSPFQGCFDFNGHYIYLNINKTAFKESDFVKYNSTMMCDIGFFSYIYAADGKPSLIRGADVRGSIAIKTDDNGESWLKNNSFIISGGGVAGTIGSNVILDGISSQVSISAQVTKATLHLGGVFGFSSADVEKWSDVTYSGLYGNISGITYGAEADVFVGGLCGVLQNARVNSFTSSARSTTFIANSYGSASEEAGNAYVGGLAGVIYVGTPDNAMRPGIPAAHSVTVENITLEIYDKFQLSAVIDNEADTHTIDSDDFSTNSSGAVAGGLVGTMYCLNATNQSNKITLSNLKFVSEGEAEIEVSAQTLDGGSRGAVYAGGLIGYIHTSSEQYIYYKASERATSEDQPLYIFYCGAQITATQNGVGPAYAGGLFGYNAFRLRSVSSGTEQIGTYYFRISDTHDFDVMAVQSSLSTNGDKLYPVMAGFYSSRLQPGYTLNEFHIDVLSGSVTAKRESGSTAVGDVAAGGVCGEYNGNSSGKFENVYVHLSDAVSINALGYSFDSDYGQGLDGNNVYAGGAVGHILNFTNATSSYISGITVDFSRVSGATPVLCAVQGVQNSVSGNSDYCTEGFVGGVFGMFEDSVSINSQSVGTGIKFIGKTDTKTLVRFFSSNNPNTASVGGAVGATRRKNYDFNLAYVKVSDAHVVGRAYFDGVQGGTDYDLYAGGAVGVLGNATSSSGCRAQYIYVYDSIIESVGEQNMLTYAGGVFGGAWWNGTITAQYCYSIGSSVMASSVSYRAYAAGISGLTQNIAISDSGVTDTTVYAKANSNAAYASGMIGRAKSGLTLKNNYTAAVVSADGNTTTRSPVVSAVDSGLKSSCQNNYYVAPNIGSIQNAYGGTPIFDNASTTLSVALNGSISANLPSGASISVADSTIATVSGSTITGINAGVTVATVYVTIDGQNYALASVTVTVANASASAVNDIVLKNESGNVIDSTNTTEYTVEGKLQYLVIHVGDSNTQELYITPSSENFGVLVDFYDLSSVTSSGIDAFKNTAQWGTATNASAFNGRATIRIAGVTGQGTEVSVVPSVVLRQRTVIGINIGNNYVVAEILPNSVEGLSVVASDDTPAMGGSGTADDPFIYAAGDTARFDAAIDYENDFYAYMVEVSFYGGEAVEGSVGSLSVMTNGTVVIGSNITAGSKYQVTCTLNDGTPTTTDEAKSYTFYILVSKKIDLSYSLSGTIIDQAKTDRLAVTGADYTFTATPQPGYGLSPEVEIAVGTTTTYKFGTLETADGSNYSVTLTGNYTVTYSVDNGTYTFTLPSDFMQGITQSTVITVSFPKVYTVLFTNEKGSDADGSRYYSVIVMSGKSIAELYSEGYFVGFESWQAGLEAFGFRKGGFYLSEDAASISSYGDSFADMCQSTGSMMVNGAVNFYLRWQYTVTTELPDGVELRSSLPVSSVDGNLVPINDRKGFGFEIVTPLGWVGSPRYDVYIMPQSGTPVNITSSFSGTLIDTYVISADTLSALAAQYASGHIYVVVYADSLTFSAGDGADASVGNEIYSDGIFTLTYSVNYAANTTLAEVSLSLSSELPKGTLIALYYSADGIATWAGSTTCTASVSSITLNNLLGFDGNSLNRKSGAATEIFNFVITLPDNARAFGDSTATISVSSQYYRFSGTVVTYNSEAVVLDDAAYFTNNSTNFIAYPAVIYQIGIDSTQNQVYNKVTGDYVEGVTDLRHLNSYYVWEIVKNGGETSSPVSGLTPVLETTVAWYYSAETPLPQLEGYTVRLLRTTTSMTPSAGSVLDEFPKN